MEHECFIGMYNNYEDTDLITYSELKEKSARDEQFAKKHEWFRQDVTPLENFFDKRTNTELTRFDYCPVCGEKIDWNELKRRCKYDR